MADVEAAVTAVNQSMIGNIAVITTRVDNIEGRVSDLIRRFEEQATGIKDAIQIELANANIKMDDIINKADREFNMHKSKLIEHEGAWVNLSNAAATKFNEMEAAYNTFYGQASESANTLNVKIDNLEKNVGVAMDKLDAKIVNVEQEQARGNGGRAGNMKDFKGKYIPLKDRKPKLMNDKIEEWRQWREDFMEYVDETNEGMKDFLQKIADLEEKPIDEFWISNLQIPDITGDRVAVFEH